MRPEGDTDNVVFSGDWRLPAPASSTVASVEFYGRTPSNIPFSGPMDWQNPVTPLDVTANGIIEPQDALWVINQLNHPTLVDSNGRLFDAATLNPVPMQFLDVNGDGYLSPVDVLYILNHLNAGTAAEGEMASPAATPLTQSVTVVSLPASNTATNGGPSPGDEEANRTSSPADYCFGNPQHAPCIGTDTAINREVRLETSDREEDLESILEDLATDVQSEWARLP